MKMKFEQNGNTVLLIYVEAFCPKSQTRERGILIRENEVNKGVVFNVSMPETQEDFEIFMQNDAFTSTEVLDTVQKIRNYSCSLLGEVIFDSKEFEDASLNDVLKWANGRSSGFYKNYLLQMAFEDEDIKFSETCGINININSKNHYSHYDWYTDEWYYISRKEIENLMPM